MSPPPSAPVPPAENRPSLRARLSRFGLGCTTFGREIGREAAFAMMDHAVARGINHFDTAAIYGGGESEQMIGDWLASRRPAPGTVLVVTKIYPPFTPALIAATVEQSRRKLGVDRLDALLFHKWADEAAAPPVLAALDAEVRAGRVGALGASNFNAEQFGRVVGLQAEVGGARLQLLQNNQNYAVRHVDDEVRRRCAEVDAAIVTYSPLGAGFLTGKHRRGVEPGSRFSIAPAHQDIYFNDEAWRRLARLEAVAARTGLTSTQLALAWAARQPGVTSVLVGGRTTAQVDQAFAALAIDDPAIWNELAAES
ncbi:MAG: aldo/keto reductase [Opitutaceae bacterium]|nr:aldo/keto reductase [Opitutaceae bacterium]